MRRWVVPLACPEKQEAVFSGECTQTIRMGEKYCVGDGIEFFEWSGEPYRSKWGRRLKTVVLMASAIELWEDKYSKKGYEWTSIPWDCGIADELARMDGLSSGIVLRDTLRKLNKSKLVGGKFTGNVAQIICWRVVE